MTKELREYALLLEKIGKQLAPSDDEAFVKIADELAFSRMLPDGQAALLIGLTGYISQFQGREHVLVSGCENAVDLLKNGRAIEALQKLTRLLGDYEVSAKLRYTGPISIAKAQHEISEQEE